MPLSNLDLRPADPLLGLMQAVARDQRPDKIDLGVGLYRNERGQTPVMDAVRMAEERLLGNTPTKAYEGPQGNLRFGELLGDLVLGDENRNRPHTTFATPGGCGALYLGMMLAARTAPQPRVWLSDPSWPNHGQVAVAARMESAVYPYRSAAPDIDAICATLEDAAPGDVLLIQGPCHNPTGIDLPLEGWSALANVVVDRGLLPMIDIAYQGFGAVFEEDLRGVQSFLSAVPEALIAYSCSKNFGLYRDRCGALVIMGRSSDEVDAARSHGAEIARRAYSMPPAHGPAIVATILDDQELHRSWRGELDGMRLRMISLRHGLAEALTPRSGAYDPTQLTGQNGMFSILPLSAEAISTMRQDSIYIPNSGRINLAGLTEAHLPRAAESLSLHL